MAFELEKWLVLRDCWSLGECLVLLGCGYFSKFYDKTPKQ